MEQELKQLSGGIKVFSSQAREIYTTYLVNGAPEEVSVLSTRKKRELGVIFSSSPQQTEVLSSSQQAEVISIFAEAENSVISLIRLSILPNFLSAQVDEYALLGLGCFVNSIALPDFCLVR